MNPRWPFEVPKREDRPPLPPGIPEEWQKANAALLQAVGTKPVASETPSLGMEQSDMSNNHMPFPWQQPPPPTFFQGYGGQYNIPPNYAYYQNYNFNYMPPNRPYQAYMNPIVTPFQPSTQFNNNIATSFETPPETPENREEKLQEKANSLAKQESSKESAYFTHVSNQAPGSGDIRFSLPKKKNQENNNFQARQQTVAQRINNFQMEDSSSPNAPSANVHNQNATQPKTSMSPEDYPESLKNYVKKCFDKCKTDVDKDQVEIILKGKLCQAQRDGSVWTKNWDVEPLPSIHSDRMEEEVKKQQNIYISKMPSVLNKKSPKKASPPNTRHSFPGRGRFNAPQSRSRSKSYSRSRSRSPPARKVIRRKHYSSSSGSSSDSFGSKKTLSSSVAIGPASTIKMKNTPNNFPKNKKNRKRNANKKPFTIDADLCTDERLLKRAARFESRGGRQRTNSVMPTISNFFFIDNTGEDLEWGSDAVIGTCQDLEKPFLRLTGAVDSSSVRPENILVKSLAMVKSHWVEKQDYHFACEQLKSIRQDLVVQCIRNPFTVLVYETHARIALEKGDHTEFNQCQSQLKALYQETGVGNRLEFTGYHVLYTMYTENTIELKDILTDLKPVEKRDQVVSHALKIAKAYSSNNYCRFFKLYVSAPKMSSFIIDWFIEKIRKAALKAIIKSFRPNIPVSHVQSALAFSNSEDCTAFLAKANLVFVDADTINCKDSIGPLATF